jgi:hypothetical protein
MFDEDQRVRLGQRAAKQVQFSSEVRQSLGVARVGPQSDREQPPCDRPIAVEEQVGDKRFESGAVDPFDPTPAGAHLEPPQHCHDHLVAHVADLPARSTRSATLHPPADATTRPLSEHLRGIDQCGFPLLDPAPERVDV